MAGFLTFLMAGFLTLLMVGFPTIRVFGFPHPADMESEGAPAPMQWRQALCAVFHCSQPPVIRLHQVLGSSQLTPESAGVSGVSGISGTSG